MKRKRSAGSPPTLGIFRNSEYPPKIPSGNEGVFLRLLPAPGLPGWHRDRSEFSFHKTYTLFSLFSELERDLISLRTKEALSAKRAQGQVLGKPKGTLQKSKF